MKKRLHTLQKNIVKNDVLKKGFFAFLGWEILLWIGFFFAGFIPKHPGFLGPVPWANLDGMHYLGIASRFGYVTYEQAFFPLFPLLIHYVSNVVQNALWSGFVVVYVSFFVMVYLLGKLAMVDLPQKKVVWVILSLLLFPTSFFFGSIYTESLFLALTLGAFYAARKHNFLLAALLAGFASGTRIVGIFLLPALLIEYLMYRKEVFAPVWRWLVDSSAIVIISLFGFLAYCGYLWQMYGDPLLFFHVQPAFGANRSGSKLILLPQVLFRYYKILTTIPVSNHDFWVALLELVMFILVTGTLVIYWKKVRPSYLFFSLAAIILPTLTGTLSSMPRYVLVAFPIFLLFAQIRSKALKVFLLSLSSILLIILTAFFLAGYFIA